jgi:phosphoglycerate dehydrogenase-like enzyme
VAQGWSLNPGRYVGVGARAPDEFVFVERLEELNEELEALKVEIDRRIGTGLETAEYDLPPGDGQRLAWLYQHGEVVARADHLVLAAPITPATQHLLNADRLARMKATAHIVNVGRGGLIDQDALLAELDKGRLWASLDVTDPEPLPAGHRLQGHPRCRITPHVSWSNPDINRRIMERLVENIRLLGAGEPLLGAID